MGVALIAAWVTAAAAEQPDAVLEAARKALAGGQPIAAWQLLQEHPAQDGQTWVRLLQARILLALGRRQEADQRLGVTAHAQMAAWPAGLRGAVAAVVGDLTLARGDLVGARGWLEQALRLGGDGVEIDRTAVLLAECAERAGDDASAERYAHLVWRDWPRSPYRARAGVIEARVVAKTRPDQARALLAGVRVLDHVEPGTRLSAAELLCQLLLAPKPGQCLVVAEQELARLPVTGRLPLYRALALAVLDRSEGLAALDVLDAALAAEPAAQAVRLQLRAAPANVHGDADRRIERARADVELGRLQAARAILEPLAATQPAALILLASIDTVALEAWLDAPALRDPAARAAVAIALARRGDHLRAWPLFLPLVTPEIVTISGLPPASLLYWAAKAAPPEDADRAAQLIAQLLARTEAAVEVGVAWAEEAQRRERSAASAEDIRAAWERSATALPGDHPWQPIAILRAARPLAESRSVETDERAMRLLEGVENANSEDQRRCWFLLAQVYARLGRTRQALQVVMELRPSANAEQRERLDRMRLRLETPAASEVREGPHDAEN